MSITRSYNKHTDTYYAYETTYEWDDKRQKKVQRKKCIGKFDPVTGELIPNGRRGRPAKQNKVQEPVPTIVDAPKVQNFKVDETASKIETLCAQIESIETNISRTTEELSVIRNSLIALAKQLLSED